MEGLGKKLKEARLARNLTLDEAGRLTKIRPGRLEEIENEDFSQFASLAYAKGFLLIYGKFLAVDVTPYLEAFESSESVTVDGYSYLQDAPDPEPIRPAKVRRRSSSGSSMGSPGGRSSFVPLIIGILVLVIGFTAMKWILQMQRLKPRPTQGPAGTPTATVSAVIAPRAQPMETAPPTTSPEVTPPPPSPTAAAVEATTPVIPAPAPAEPEVRRAEPVHSEDAAAIPTPTPSPKRSPRRLSPTPTIRPNISGTPRPNASPTARL
ncbi:MAG: helix-turn-helix domain-containing protein [Chthoniobacterales bacterium]